MTSNEELPSPVPLTAGNSSCSLPFFSTQSNNSSSPLLIACVEGEKHSLQKCITEDPECMEMRDHCGRTPLIFCVLADRLDCAKILLDHNADPSAMDNGRRTALHWAAHKDNYQFVKLLVARGVDCCSKDAEGLTPLHLATHHQSTKCLAFLLKQLLPGEIDIQDDNKRTPLHWSASFGNADHVKLLLKQDSNVGLPDSEGKTPLHWAVNGKGPGAITTAELLLDVAPSVINWQDYEGRTALHLAISEGNADMVGLLTCWDSSKMDCLDNMFRTPMHWAAVLGHAQIINMLLDRNADWSCSDANGATPLHYAAQKDHYEAVEALMNHSSVTDEPDIEGRTALMWAAGRGADNVIRVMLDFDHDIHATDKNGGMALHAACISGQPSTVKLLIQKGADINANDMMKHTPLFRTCELGHVEIAEALIEHGASLSSLDEAGRTPLHWAGYSGHVNICYLLLNAGMDANARDFSGRSPLHCAAYGGHTECMDLLIKSGANINIQDKEGMTALHWCCSSGYLEAVTLLFQYQAYPNHIEFTEDRYTPLDYALLGGHQEVSQFMIEHGALSIIGIQDIAASKIQAFYRGHRVRKSFQERRLLMMKHEELRIAKRKSEVLRRVDDMTLLTSVGPPLQAIITEKKQSASKSSTSMASASGASHEHVSSSCSSIQGTLYSTLSNEKESLVSSSLDLSDVIFPALDKSVADTVADERQRLSEFRNKSEAASTIQKAWRDYMFHSMKLVKTFREIIRTKRFLSREQQLRREMAALTIQLAWRRYYRKKIQKSLYPNRKMLHHWSEPIRVSKQSFLVSQIYGERMEVCDWITPKDQKAARPSYFKYIPSPAALSYNFAADQYHPVMARQGITGMSTFTQSSSRVQNPQLKQLPEWPSHTATGVGLYADELLNLPITPSTGSDRFSYNLR